MKTKQIILAILLSLNAVSCQAGIIKLASIIIPTAYITTRYNQSNNDYSKMKRLIRKDKDYACDYTINILKQQCNNDLCKDIIKILEEAKSSVSQQLEDSVQENIEIGKSTETYKSTEKLIEKCYQTIKNQLDENSKKVNDKIDEITKDKK